MTQEPIPIPTESVLFLEPTIGIDEQEEDGYMETIVEDDEPQHLEPVAIAEETQIITKVSMFSRNLKVKISTELLTELENLQVNFKLN